MEFTEAILQEIAATYDPALSEALSSSVTPAHAPVYGWARAWRCARAAHAPSRSLSSQKPRTARCTRSAALRCTCRTHQATPVPGKHYLRHIGFLGAVPPAIKGIPDA
ncbi:hypothetical protein P4050_15960 [Pseudomonas aeruginosa]|nr:hypothetical protein [Pseudomonas aeruginosa]